MAYFAWCHPFASPYRSGERPIDYIQQAKEVPDRLLPGRYLARMASPKEREALTRLASHMGHPRDDIAMLYAEKDKSVGQQLVEDFDKKLALMSRSRPTHTSSSRTFPEAPSPTPARTSERRAYLKLGGLPPANPDSDIP